MECQDRGGALSAEARFCSNCGARIKISRDAPDDALREALEKAIGFQYRIERLLGRGGMGAFYLAHELALDRDVAIKVLPPDSGTGTLGAVYDRASFLNRQTWRGHTDCERIGWDRRYSPPHRGGVDATSRK